MKALITWSGTPSHLIAQSLREHLPKVLDIELWLSSRDLQAGDEWFKELRAQLADTEIGLLVFTSENINSDWMQFEAGALAKLEKSRIIPLCLDVGSLELPEPLQQFQKVHLLNGEHQKLIEILNKELSTGFSDKQMKEKGAILGQAMLKAVERAASIIEANASDPLQAKAKTLETLSSFATELRHARYERLAKAAASPNICALCDVNKNPEVNITSILMQMRQTLCSQYKIPSSYIDLHIIGRAFDKENEKAFEKWEYIFPLNSGRAGRTPAAQLMNTSLARTCLNLNKAYFFPDKNPCPPV